MFEGEQMQRELAAAAATLAALPRGASSQEDWATLAEQCQALTNTVNAVQSVALARAAAFEVEEYEDGTWASVERPVGHQALDAPSIVSDRLGCSETAATDRVADAVMVLADLPEVFTAMCDGRIDAYRVKRICAELGEAPPSVRRAVSKAIAPDLGRLTAPRLGDRCRAVLGRIDEELLRQRCERARRRRGLYRGFGEPGLEEWTMILPAEEAGPLWSALDEPAQAFVREGLAETIGQARLDALLAMIKRQLVGRFDVVLTFSADDVAAASAGATRAAQRTQDTAEPAAATRQSGAPSQGDPSGKSSRGGSGTADPALANSPVATHDADSDTPSRDADGAGGHDPTDPHPSDPQPPESCTSDRGERDTDRHDSVSPSSNDDVANRRRLAAHAEAVAAWLILRGSRQVEVGGLAPALSGVPAAWLAERLLDGAAATRLTAAGAGERSSTRLPSTRLRQSACDKRTGALGPPTPGPDELSSPAYVPPKNLAAFVRARDRRCRFPGCSVPAARCDLDHVRAWPDGPTDHANLVCLCRRHHRIKQRPGWLVRLDGHGVLHWTDPTGRFRTSAAPDVTGATLPSGLTTTTDGGRIAAGTDEHDESPDLTSPLETCLAHVLIRRTGIVPDGLHDAVPARRRARSRELRQRRDREAATANGSSNRPTIIGLRYAPARLTYDPSGPPPF